MLAERVGISRTTYSRVEKGDPTVSMGIYAMTLFVLGLGTPMDSVADTTSDEQGRLFSDRQLPKRIRPRKDPQPL